MTLSKGVTRSRDDCDSKTRLLNIENVHFPRSTHTKVKKLASTETSCKMIDYITTIDSDTEEHQRRLQDDAREKEDPGFNPDFVFDVTGDPYVDVMDQHHALDDLVKTRSKPVRSNLAFQEAYHYNGLGSGLGRCGHSPANSVEEAKTARW